MTYVIIAVWAVVFVGALVGLHFYEKREIRRDHEARTAARLAVFDAFVERDSRELERLFQEKVLRPQAQALGLPVPRLIIRHRRTAT